MTRLLVLVLASLAVALPGSELFAQRGERPFEKRRNNALSFLQHEITAYRDHIASSKGPINPAVLYRRRASEQTLEKLQKADRTEFASPRVFLAVFAETEKTLQDGKASLDVQWFEDGFRSTGLYLADASGTVLATYTWPGWDEDYRSIYNVTLWRGGKIVVRLDEQLRPGDQKLNAPALDFQLPIRPSLLAQDLKVGLLDAQGKPAPPTNAFLSEELRRLAAKMVGQPKSKGQSPEPSGRVETGTQLVWSHGPPAPDSAEAPAAHRATAP